jgi:hypothetical protein
MNVFISWSGETSHEVAQILRMWLPSVLQSVKPYVSSEDIAKGARWSEHIARLLEETSFGIICVTSDNVGSPWLNFEAGALSKSVVSSRVTPFLLGINPVDLVGPLAQFQATLPRIDDVNRLVRSINDISDQPIDQARLDESVRVWWPRLNDRLQEITRQEALKGARPKRDTRGIIEETLEISRWLQRRAIQERAKWVGSSFSSGQDRIEVAVGYDFVAMRDSSDPEGPMLLFSPSEWQDFIRRVRRDEYDLKDK